jgi:hypothetical protein
MRLSTSVRFQMVHAEKLTNRVHNPACPANPFAKWLYTGRERCCSMPITDESRVEKGTQRESAPFRNNVFELSAGAGGQLRRIQSAQTGHGSSNKSVSPNP